ncbi:unnamed protein product [Leuciscus chuanchicus]
MPPCDMDKFSSLTEDDLTKQVLELSEELSRGTLHITAFAELSEEHSDGVPSETVSANAPGVGQTCCLPTQPGQVGPDGSQPNCHASAQPATQQKEEAHQPRAVLPRPIQHPGESLEMTQFILTQCLVFSESEKMVSEKKPAGTVSPPTGSPTPAAPPSSVQHNTMARHQGVDTSMLRRAIWNYIQCKFGIREFLFTGAVRFGEPWLVCAPLYKDFIRLYRFALDAGTNPCHIHTDCGGELSPAFNEVDNLMVDLLDNISTKVQQSD